MVANVSRFKRFPLIHYRVVQGFLNLSNPNKTVRKPLVSGWAAGQLQLIYALFPPEGFHTNSVPARFTVDFEATDDRPAFERANFELHLMVHLIDRNGGGDDFVFGLVSHDQRQKIYKCLPIESNDVDIMNYWVGVKYSPTRREGHVFLSRKLYDLLRKLPVGFSSDM